MVVRKELTPEIVINNYLLIIVNNSPDLKIMWEISQSKRSQSILHVNHCIGKGMHTRKDQKGEAQRNQMMTKSHIDHIPLKVRQLKMEFQTRTKRLLRALLIKG